MEQTSFKGKQKAEQRVLNALESVAPDGDIDCTMLRRYTQWSYTHEIPLEELRPVCIQAEKEKRFKEYLGDTRYFDHITAGAKIDLYLAALYALKDALPQMGCPLDEGIFFEKFRALFNVCLKECDLNKKIPEKKKPKKISKNDIKMVKEIVGYLNKKAGRSFRTTTPGTQRVIRDQLNKNYTVSDFKKVIDDRVRAWNHPPEPGEKDNRVYLRPETLFGPKFESYLQAVPGGAENTKPDLLADAPYKPMELHRSDITTWE